MRSDDRSKLKVWLLLSRFDLGGLERVQANIAPALAASGLDVTIVAGQFVVGSETLLPAGVATLEVAPGGASGFFVGLVRQLRRHRPNLIISTSNDVTCLLLMIKGLFHRDLRIISAQHLSISGPFNRARGAKRLKLSLIRWLSRMLLPRADVVVCVSRQLADDVRRSLKLPNEIVVIHNPILMPDFELRVNERIPWPWRDNAEPTVIFVGRLSPEKRLDLLLDAFREVADVFPCRLVILGDGPLRREVQSSIADLGLERLCYMAGFQANPFPWIRRADLLVLPSDYEGFGNVLVEAMACGTQVVATNCPDGPAEVLDHGSYGQLVPTGDLTALSAAMLASLRFQFCVPREQLVKRAHEFTLEQAAQRYLSVIHAAWQA